MAAFSDYLESGILGYTLRGGSLAQPTKVYLALFTSDPTDAGTGNEVTDSAYARQDAAVGGSISSGWTAPNTSGTGTSVENAKAIEFPAIADGSVTVTHFAVYDATTSGNLLYHGPFATPKTLDVDDIASVAAGSVTVTLK